MCALEKPLFFFSTFPTAQSALQLELQNLLNSNLSGVPTMLESMIQCRMYRVGVVSTELDNDTMMVKVGLEIASHHIPSHRPPDPVAVCLSVCRSCPMGQ